MEKRFYVYVLFDWLGIPRYVGKGTGNRWLEHERRTDPVNLLKNEFIERTWIMLGEIPKIKVVDQLASEDAVTAEISFIRAIGRLDLGTGPLVNMTDGGEGGVLNPSEELRARLRARPQYERSPEWRAALAERNRARAGIPHTEEHKGKLRLAMLGREITWADKIGSAQRGIPETEQAKQNMRKPKSEQGRANIAAAARARPPRSATGNAKHGAAMKALWADPEFRAKVLIARRKNKIR